VGPVFTQNRAKPRSIPATGGEPFGSVPTPPSTECRRHGLRVAPRHAGALVTGRNLFLPRPGTSCHPQPPRSIATRGKGQSLGKSRSAHRGPDEAKASHRRGVISLKSALPMLRFFLAAYDRSARSFPRCARQLPQLALALLYLEFDPVFVAVYGEEQEGFQMPPNPSTHSRTEYRVES